MAESSPQCGGWEWGGGGPPGKTSGDAGEDTGVLSPDRGPPHSFQCEPHGNLTFASQVLIT